MATTATHEHTLQQRVMGGIVGGLTGGIVFGMLMGIMGMLPMVAQVVGSDSALVGLVYHMFNSVVIGVGQLLSLVARAIATVRLPCGGLLYGAIWWSLGPLILMPLLLGMPLFMAEPGTLEVVRAREAGLPAANNKCVKQGRHGSCPLDDRAHQHVFTAIMPYLAKELLDDATRLSPVTSPAAAEANVG